MPVSTIMCPDADKCLKVATNKHAREHNQIDIDPDQKFAIVLLKLAPAVTSADYPTLKTNIEAITGIQDISLLIDGKVPTTIPANTSACIHVRAHVEIADD